MQNQKLVNQIKPKQHKASNESRYDLALKSYAKQPSHFSIFALLPLAVSSFGFVLTKREIPEARKPMVKV